MPTDRDKMWPGRVMLGAPVKEDFRDCAHSALDDFWSRVMKYFGNPSSGDLSPERAMALENAALDAIEEWWNSNCKDQI